MEEKAKEKKSFMICGISIWRIMTYFVIYSIVGFVVETLYGLATKGVLESRRSFLYGPFCSIYGLGAVVMILSLQYFKKNNFTLFIGGFIVGSIVEYFISFVGEMLFHVKWWDYSGMPFNINGRICFSFSLFWGVLAIFLMTYLNVKVDKWIDKVKERKKIKMLKKVVLFFIIFLIFDCLITGFALKMFFTRLVLEHDLEIQNADKYLESGKKLYENPIIKDISDTLFSDKKMLRTFPNLKVTGKDGNIIYIDSVLKDIQPYYLKVFTPRQK